MVLLPVEHNCLEISWPSPYSLPCSVVTSSREENLAHLTFPVVFSSFSLISASRCARWSSTPPCIQDSLTQPTMSGLPNWRWNPHHGDRRSLHGHKGCGGTARSHSSSSSWVFPGTPRGSTGPAFLQHSSTHKWVKGEEQGAVSEFCAPCSTQCTFWAIFILLKKIFTKVCILRNMQERNIWERSILLGAMGLQHQAGKCFLLRAVFFLWLRAAGMFIFARVAWLSQSYLKWFMGLTDVWYSWMCPWLSQKSGQRCHSPLPKLSLYWLQKPLWQYCNG